MKKIEGLKCGLACGPDGDAYRAAVAIVFPKDDKKKEPSLYWAALDLLFPEHGGMEPVTCSDEHPHGGNWGCKRCQVIDQLEKRHIKIWPRSVMTYSKAEWDAMKPYKAGKK